MAGAGPGAVQEVSEAVAIPLPPVTGPQLQILRIHEREERFWDVEGAPRSAKSWGAAIWIWLLVYLFPGIHIFYCRYKDDDLKTLREVWGKVSALFPSYLQPVWNTKEESWDFPNGEWRGEVYSGSRVYLSSLRVAEATTSESVHGKYKGKTLAVIICEEAQEIPKINYEGLKERLSQSKDDMGVKRDYPLKLVLVHNSVNKGHWIDKEFPLDGAGNCTKPGHAHIRADLYSNAANLGETVMAGYEMSYPVGHPLRTVAIEGRRGLTRTGSPVYEHEFKRRSMSPIAQCSCRRIHCSRGGTSAGRSLRWCGRSTSHTEPSSASWARSRGRKSTWRASRLACWRSGVAGFRTPR
jgi:hypothetical protein